MQGNALFQKMRWVVLAAALVPTLWLVPAALGLRQELNNESMRGRDSEQEAVQAAFARDFGSDANLILGVTHPRLLEPEGLRLLADLTARIEKLPGVSRTISLSNLDEFVAGPDGAIQAPLLREATGPDARAAVERALERNPRLVGLLVSEDRRTTGIAIQLESRSADPSERGRLIEALRALERSFAIGDLELHLTGITVQQHVTTRLVERDRSILVPLSVIVLATALLIVTRSGVGVVLPILVTLLTLGWTLGIYARLGYRINIITSLLPPVIMVLSITTSMHLIQGWVAMARRYPDRVTLARHVLSNLAIPCCLTGLTTAIGLSSLAISDIPAVQQFGLFSALGVLISVALNLTLLPAILSLIRRPAKKTQSLPGRWFRRSLRWCGRVSVQRPVVVVVVAILLSAAAVPGVARIRNNTDLLRFLESDTDLVRDTEFIDRNLVGTNSFELSIRRLDDAPLTSVHDVARLHEFSVAARELPEVTSAIGIADLIAQLHRAETDSGHLELPTDPDELLYYFDLLDAAEDREGLGQLITPDFRRTRVTLRLHAIGSHDAVALLRRIELLQEQFLGAAYVVEPAGEFYLIVTDTNGIVASQVESFGIALAAIFLSMAVVFRSGRLLLAASIPNLAPVLWTAGFMGWAGIDLSIGTVMIASVVLGIAVDGSIHYLARFRYEYRNSAASAIQRTTATTGRVLVITSCVLAVGFWVGALGSFEPTIYFSILTGVTMLTALVCDLLVLPACLMLIRPRTRDRR